MSTAAALLQTHTAHTCPNPHRQQQLSAHNHKQQNREQPIVGGYYDGYNHQQQQQSPYMPAGLQPQQPQQQHHHQQYRQEPTGARLKVMRCVQLKAPDSKRALLDFGLGVGVDLDRQVRVRCGGAGVFGHQALCMVCRGQGGKGGTMNAACGHVCAQTHATLHELRWMCGHVGDLLDKLRAGRL